MPTLANGFVTPDCRRKVSLIVYPGFKTLEATGPLTVLCYASQHLEAAGHAGGYDVTFARRRSGRCVRIL